MEEIEKEIPIISYEMEKMHEEIIFLRHEVAELWWSHNGWKFKERDKLEIFKVCREAYKALPNDFRKGETSDNLLTEYFLSFVKARNEQSSKS